MCSRKKDKIRGVNPWSSTFLAKFLIQANNQALRARHVHVIIFRALLSVTCFSRELLVHIKQNHFSM